MNCIELKTAIHRLDHCSESLIGTALKTHCLYPSFSPVYVYISNFGDGFRISDNGGGAQSALKHGVSKATILSTVKSVVKQYSVNENDGVLSIKVESKDWLDNAILAIANSSSLLAAKALEVKETSTKNELKPLIVTALSSVVPIENIATDFSLRGKSGKKRGFDVAITGRKNLIFNGVSANANSVNSNFTAFSDIHEQEIAGLPLQTFCVFSNKPMSEDVTLLNMVARLVPIGVLAESTKREFNLHV